MFGEMYRDRRVLITGHTGFKGSWLMLWLHVLGARLTGISLPLLTVPNHWDLLGLNVIDRRIDIRQFDLLMDIVTEVQPEIVFHLAAQPLVRRSYRNPLETWTTNVQGTANVLEACRLTPSIRAIVVVTTDKCYENREWFWGYREQDRLGGHDPYSASKAAAELVSASYRSAFFGHGNGPLLATVRAGNVVGGGDWSEDRLIPDLVRALVADVPLVIRSPQAIRPWQHVLDPLAGYLLLGQKLLEGCGEQAEAWNFGPGPESKQPVVRVLEKLRSYWLGLKWEVSSLPQPHEAGLLYLDSAKARHKLGWQPVWGFESGLRATAEWYQRFLESDIACSREQLNAYLATAQLAKQPWAES